MRTWIAERVRAGKEERGAMRTMIRENAGSVNTKRGRERGVMRVDQGTRNDDNAERGSGRTLGMIIGRARSAE